MGKAFGILGIAASVGGFTVSAHALKAVELDIDPLMQGMIVPAIGMAVYPDAEGGGELTRVLDSPQAGTSPYRFGGLVSQERVAASWGRVVPVHDPAALTVGLSAMERDPHLAPGLKEEGDWGAQLMAGLAAITFLMWRRLQPL